MCGGGGGGKGEKARETNLEVRQARTLVWTAGCLDDWSGRPWCWPEGSSPPATLVRGPVSLAPTARSKLGSLHLQRWSRAAPPPPLVSPRLSIAVITKAGPSSLPPGCSALQQGSYLDGAAEQSLKVRHRCSTGFSQLLRKKKQIPEDTANLSFKLLTARHS